MTPVEMARRLTTTSAFSCASIDGASHRKNVTKLSTYASGTYTPALSMLPAGLRHTSPATYFGVLPLSVQVRTNQSTLFTVIFSATAALVTSFARVLCYGCPPGIFYAWNCTALLIPFFQSAFLCLLFPVRQVSTCGRFHLTILQQPFSKSSVRPFHVSQTSPSQYSAVQKTIP